MDKKSILMIDDVKLNLATAKDVLQNEYILYEASSAQEGFDILNKHIPDLILMDLVMPEMDGYEMIEILKSTRRFMGIPVIILTAHTDSENEVKALELGAADFITKPFVPAVMKRRIETQIELSSYQHSLEKLVQEKVEEVEKLLHQGYNKEMLAFKAIGYKEIIAYLNHDLSYEAAIDLLKKNTRHFAKRQLTWFRRDPNIKWLMVDEMDYPTLLSSAIKYI